MAAAGKGRTGVRQAKAGKGSGAVVESAAERLDAERADATGHCMYVLECADLTLYTGYAVDVASRVAVHNAGKGAKYTRSRRPVRLLAAAAFATKHDAMSAEARFKGLTRAEKKALLAQAQAARSFAAVLAERFDLELPEQAGA